MGISAEKASSNKNHFVNITKLQKQNKNRPTFQFVDNRPEASAQQKLQAVAEESPQTLQLLTFHNIANAVSSQQLNPVQRKSGRPSEIAAAMGAQYGVDTSSLRFTHNSSFPDALGAAATIQGSDIHFAPGQDTTHNIKHEVGHFIDNAKNGTPKGDKMINGQLVDTTREQVADQIADQTLQNKALSKDSTVEIENTGNPSEVVQRLTEREKREFYNVDIHDLYEEGYYFDADDYLAENVSHLLEKGINPRESQARDDSLSNKHSNTEFDNDIALWTRTLNDKNSVKLSKDEERVLKEQQDVLLRHFVAMAYLGPQFGGQKKDNHSKKAFNDKFNDVPLAALASHGGRFAYEIEGQENAESFFNYLLYGQKTSRYKEIEGPHRGAPRLKFSPDLLAPLIRGTGTRAVDSESRKKNVPAGFYERGSSHPQHFDEKKGSWQEGKGMINRDNAIKQFGYEAGSLGMNIPMGGVGNKSGENTYIGSEGAVIDQYGKATGAQHGHAFFKYNKTAAGGGSGRMMVGFEGSAPSLDSLVGAHDASSMQNGKGNSRSITGQSKGEDINLPTKDLGALKATVNENNLGGIKEVFEKLKTLNPEQKKHVSEVLLKSKTEEERAFAIQLIFNLQADNRRKHARP